jgi:hypothetical protein
MVILLRVGLLLVASLNVGFWLLLAWAEQRILDIWLLFGVLAAGIPLVLAVLAAVLRMDWAAFAYAVWNLVSAALVNIWIFLGDPNAPIRSDFNPIVVEGGLLLPWAGVIVGLVLGVQLRPHRELAEIVGTLVGFDPMLGVKSQTRDERLADLDQRRAAGQLAEAVYRFRRAQLEKWPTGKQPLFNCGRCGKRLSLAWDECGHCRAAFDEFPPVDTGQVV